MFKRLPIVIAALAVVIVPFLPGVAAGSVAKWAELLVSKTWEYSDYEVSRLSASSNTFMKFGETLVMVARAESCKGSCDLRDLYLLGNGGSIKVVDVPTIAVDEQLVAKSDDRLVYAEFSDDTEARVNVIEVDLDTGVKSTLVEEAFLTDAEQIKITVDQELIYAEVSFDLSLDAQMADQKMIYVYNPRYEMFKALYVQYNLENEELVDAEDGSAIVKMTFSSGEEQLWVYDYVEFGEQSATAIPSTWTVDVEDLVAAHYTDDGSIEFFRQYARHLTNPSLDETESFTQYLSWYREYDSDDLRNIVQTDDGNMVWVDPDSTLWASDGTTVVEIADIGGSGTFRLIGDTVLWSNGLNGGIDTINGKTLYNLDFMPTDLLEDVVVGQDVLGNVIYMNLETGKQMTIGYGGSPLIADARHVYWKGSDAHLYQATIYLSSAIDSNDGTAVKTASSPKVYMVVDGTASYIPNESIYLTWFASFAEVKTITEGQLALYAIGETVGLQPGALVKVSGSSKVYAVGTDGKLHWVVTSEVARDLYGSSWSDAVVTVRSADVVNVAYGASIASANDMAKTVLSEVE